MAKSRKEIQPLPFHAFQDKAFSHRSRFLFKRRIKGTVVPCPLRPADLVHIPCRDIRSNQTEKQGFSSLSVLLCDFVVVVAVLKPRTSTKWINLFPYSEWNRHPKPSGAVQPTLHLYCRDYCPGREGCGITRTSVIKEKLNQNPFSLFIFWILPEQRHLVRIFFSVVWVYPLPSLRLR